MSEEGSAVTHQLDQGLSSKDAPLLCRLMDAGAKKELPGEHTANSSANCQIVHIICTSAGVCTVYIRETGG